MFVMFVTGPQLLHQVPKLDHCTAVVPSQLISQIGLLLPIAMQKLEQVTLDNARAAIGAQHAGQGWIQITPNQIVVGDLELLFQQGPR